jgi:hypothetical protein
MLKIKNFLILFAIFFISCGPSIEERRELYKQRGWDDEIIEVILGGRVRLGMTADQVRESWGKPEEVWRSITRGFKKEHWKFRMLKPHFFFYDYRDGKGLILESMIE